MQQMYDMIMQHKRAMQDMQLLWEKALQQHQHGYDSDEEVDSELGTWEHQLRRMEMDKTRGALRSKAGGGAGEECLGGALPLEHCGVGSPTHLLACKALGSRLGLLCLSFLSSKRSGLRLPPLRLFLLPSSHLSHLSGQSGLSS